MLRVLLAASLFFSAQLITADHCADVHVTQEANYVVPPIEDSHIITGIGSESHLNFNKRYNLLVWNIYKGAKENLYFDLKNLLASSDISLLQEIMLYKTEADDFYKDYSHFEWNFALSFFNGDREATGVSNVSRFKSYESKIYRSNHTEPVINTPKMSIVQKFKINGAQKKLMVINIHGINFVQNKKFYAQLEPLLKEIENHSGPIIFAGDFNTHNHWRNKYLNKKLEDHGLERLKLDGDKRVMALDHVFVKGVSVHASVLRSDVESSDHAPIMVEFELGTGSQASTN